MNPRRGHGHLPEEYKTPTRATANLINKEERRAQVHSPTHVADPFGKLRLDRAFCYPSYLRTAPPRRARRAERSGSRAALCLEGWDLS